MESSRLITVAGRTSSLAQCHSSIKVGNSRINRSFRKKLLLRSAQRISDRAAFKRRPFDLKRCEPYRALRLQIAQTPLCPAGNLDPAGTRSEEHMSELQPRGLIS